MATPHILVLPLPEQGHVIPLMALCHRLVDRGFKITFVNTEFNHARIANALSGKAESTNIKLVSIPDGMEADEDRSNVARMCQSMTRVMPGQLEQLVRKINESEVDKISWMVVDQGMAFASSACKKMGIRVAVFWPSSAAFHVLLLSIPKLTEEGFLDQDATPIKKGMIKLGPDMPPMDTSQFWWYLAVDDPKQQKIITQYTMANNSAAELAEFIVCNSFYGLESATFSYMPRILPIGPLVVDERSEKPPGHFWAEDTACMNWLNEQAEGSVVYAAFGSTTVLNLYQFQELALGLERSARPFLWVVRPDLTSASDGAYPEGFRDRVAARGLIVGWSPQQKVLAHPSVGCFLTHCGWNSTIEGVRNGVTFLCRPYFSDQFFNQRYVCEVWKVGLRLSPDDNGIVSSEEVRLKLEEAFGDVEMKARALALKEKASDCVREGGSSYININNFVQALKE